MTRKKPTIALVEESVEEEFGKELMNENTDEGVDDGTTRGASRGQETLQEASLPPQELRLLEAILFASAEPISAASLQSQMGDTDVGALLEELKKFYTPRGVNLVENDGHWSFRTSADLASNMKITRTPRRKLPRAAAEVLAIIAYHQPVTRGEVESIRGVETSRGTLDILLELGWVRPGKRRETPGRPLTWNTTTEFLSHFNITSLDDLPGIEELKAAGLLDTRPVLATLQRDTEEGPVVEEDDEDFAAWIIDDNGDERADQPVAAAAE